MTHVLLENQGPPITASVREGAWQGSWLGACRTHCMRQPLLQRLQKPWRPISASSDRCPIRWLNITEKSTEARSRDARKARCSRKWCCVEMRGSRVFHGTRIKLKKPQGTRSEDRANSQGIDGPLDPSLIDNPVPRLRPCFKATLLVQYHRSSSAQVIRNHHRRLRRM